jgi:hypothetical protein
MKVTKDIIQAIILFLDGKRTYLVGISLICTGIAAHDWHQVQEGLAAIFLRTAINKV